MRNDANHLNKYIDVTREWKTQAIDLKVMLATNKRHYVDLAKNERVRGNDKLVSFIMSSSQLNDRVEELLLWMTDFLNEVEKDAKFVFDGAELRNKLQDQSETIVTLMQERDKLTKQITDEFRRHTKITQ